MGNAQLGAFGTTRAVVVALVGGVALVWVAAWVLTDGGSSGLSPGAFSQAFALALWAVVALPAFGAALFFRNRAAGAAPGGRVPGPRREASDSGVGAGHRAQTSLIVAHALLEGPALLGGVLFLLLGNVTFAAVALPVYALGLVLTWPQRAWFAEGRASPS